MNIPNFVKSKLVDKDGNLTEIWQQVLDQLINELQSNLSEEGFKIPKQTTANINKLNSSDLAGNIVYDKNTHELKANINGVIKVIQVI